MTAPNRAANGGTAFSSSPSLARITATRRMLRKMAGFHSKRNLCYAHEKSSRKEKSSGSGAMP